MSPLNAVRAVSQNGAHFASLFWPMMPIFGCVSEERKLKIDEEIDLARSYGDVYPLELRRRLAIRNA